MKLENKKNYKTNYSSGFSLMEVMLSVAILSMGIVASFSLISSSMAKFSSATNKIIASNLAQDGIERVRNVRDTNWLQGWTEPDDTNGKKWDTDIDGDDDREQFVRFSCVDNEMKPAIDASDISGANEGALITDCISEGKCRINRYYNGTSWNSPSSTQKCISDNMGNKPGYNRDVYPGFYRLIHISQVDSKSNKVSVTIKWLDRTGTHYFTAEEILYNWKETGP